VRGSPSHAAALCAALIGRLRPASYLHIGPEAWLADVLARAVDHKIVIDVRQSFEEGAHIRGRAAARSGAAAADAIASPPTISLCQAVSQAIHAILRYRGEDPGNERSPIWSRYYLGTRSPPLAPWPRAPRINVQTAHPGLLSEGLRRRSRAAPGWGPIGPSEKRLPAVRRCVAWSRAECLPRR
jgi:hypothetical protein